MAKEIMDLAASRSQNVNELMADIFEMELDQSDEKIKKQVENFYVSKIKSKVFTLEEQVVLLSGLGQYQSFFSWTMGDIILDIEKKINAGNYPEIKSLNQFYDKYSHEIGISKSVFYDCRKLRDLFESFEAFLKVGIKKAAVLAQIKSDEVFNEVAKEASKKTVSVEKLKEMVATIISDHKQEKFEQIKKDIRRIGNRHRVDIIVDDKRIKSNELLVICSDEDERDRFNMALNKRIDDIKKDMEHLKLVDI